MRKLRNVKMLYISMYKIFCSVLKMAILTSIFVGLLGILIYLLIKYPDRSIGTKRRSLLNGPKGLPLIGNFLDIRKEGLLMFMYETLMEYGPNATYTLPGFGRVITINNPECLEHVMKTNFEGYIRGKMFYKLLYDMFGDGIFNSNGIQWKTQRRLSNHLFNSSSFREIIYVVFEEETKRVLNILEKLAEAGEPFDLQDLFYRFTLDSLGKIMFESDFKCLADPNNPVKFAQAFDFAQTVLSHRLENPIWKITELFTEEGRKMRETCSYLSDFACEIIEQRRSDPEALKDPKDVLNLFVNCQSNDGTRLTDKEFRDVVLNLIIAGRDTTAQALSWMMYNLMVNPSVEEKLVKEVNSLLSPENPISNHENIKQFRYTQATFYEALRLHPVVPLHFKICLKDDVLPNGIPIYAGEVVNWSSWAAGRDERIWGEDAKIFNPERFLNSKDGLKPSQYKFTSFNCGPRICLGQNFATIQAMTLVTAMLRKFKFEMIPGQKCPPDYAFSITLPMKNPLLVRVYYRG